MAPPCLQSKRSTRGLAKSTRSEESGEMKIMLYLQIG
jgi:hypothetical protein